MASSSEVNMTGRAVIVSVGAPVSVAVQPQTGGRQE